MSAKHILKRLIKEELKSLLKESNNKSSEDKKSIAYTALVLYIKDHNLLSSLYKKEGWDTIAHHVTLNMGPFKGNRELLNKDFEVTVISYAEDNLVAAVKVQLPKEISSVNVNPHITISVNRKQGGKPVMSNNLDWSNAKSIKPITINAKLAEVEQGQLRFADQY